MLLGVVVHIFNPSYLGSRGRGIMSSRPAPTKKDPVSKTKKAKWLEA
jgi:hypothetical protein